MSDEIGSIRQREAKDVIRDRLIELGVPKSLWKINRKQLDVLVGSRAVSIPLPPGMTFYGLKSALERIDAIARDIQRAKLHSQQVDLEEAIAATQ